MRRISRDRGAPDRDGGAVGVDRLDLGRGDGALDIRRHVLVDGEVRPGVEDVHQDLAHHVVGDVAGGRGARVAEGEVVLVDALALGLEL